MDAVNVSDFNTASEFNTASGEQLRPVLTACLAVPRWVAAMVAARPYPDLAAVLARSDEIARTLSPGEIRQAVAGHPRIGERRAGADTAARWSRSEQSGVDESLAERLRAANHRYEERFGHIYLVCATGRGGAEILADLEQRLGNDPATELAVVGRELAEIAKVRLRKAVTG